MHTLSPFNFEDSLVRVMTRDGDPWFVPTDVCRILSIKNAPAASRRLDADDRMTIGFSDSHSGQRGGARSLVIINESGLYTLVLRSDDAMRQGTVAHRFRKWVTSDLLPTLRRTGAYILPNNGPSAPAGGAIRAWDAGHNPTSACC